MSEIYKIPENLGLNPNADEGYGSGFVEGLLVWFDIIGTILHIILRKNGLNIVAIGGLALFGQTTTKFSQNHNPSRMGAKTLVIVGGVMIMIIFSPLLKIWAVFQIAALIINACVNLRTYVLNEGNLRAREN